MKKCTNQNLLQSSDLATLGRRTSAMETLVTQLREAAETSVVPQEEEKGEEISVCQPFRARSPHYNPSPLSNSFDPFLWIISALGQMQGLTTGIFKMQMIRDMDLLPPELLF